MARNRTITLTGNETKEIYIEDFYDSCVLRSIETSGTGSLSVEWQDALGNWHPFKGGTVNTAQTEAVSCRIHGNVINNVRVTSTGFQGGDTITVTLFFSSELISSIDQYTTSGGNTGRVKTDSQPSSFEENYQFRIFHRFIGVPNGTQMIFKFAVTNPVNIQDRKINLWSGGREYLVVPVIGAGIQEAEAALTTPVQVRTVNNNLRDSGLPSHPVSGVTVTYGTGVGLIAIADDDQFPNGDAVLSDASGNKGNSNLLESPNLSGVGENQSFYLVFSGINGNDGTSGHFLVQWEERF